MIDERRSLGEGEEVAHPIAARYWTRTGLGASLPLIQLIGSCRVNL